MLATFGTSAVAHAAPTSNGVPSRPGRQLSIDWALSGTATATSSQPGSPPSNAIDGNGATAWCTSSWPDSLTVALGQARKLDGVGITLESASASASASLSLATQPGNWHVVTSARNVALDPGNPMYIPLGSRYRAASHRGPLSNTMTARYAELTIYDSGSAPVCVGELRLFGPDPAASHMMLGADMSFTSQELAAGTVFTDRGVAANPIAIMSYNGANWVRFRLWVNPPAGYSSLATDLALARSARRAGLRIFLDIHYSDFWADPGKQCIPAAWPTSLPQLAATVRTYTKHVIAAFAAQRTPVAMVSIGNEVTNGMLWSKSLNPPGPSFGCSGPGVGGLTWSSDTSAAGWGNFTRLLKAGIAGARAGNPLGQELLVAIHTDLGGGQTPYGHNDTARSQYFYSELEAHGVAFDVIALSYYPLYQGSLSGMRTTVDNLANVLRKPVVIAETQYPWTLANGDTLGNSIWQPSQLTAGYPASPGGQISFVNDELSILAAVPHGLGAGLFYWAPDWVPGVSWAPGAQPPGTSLDNQTLFDFQGRALPSIGIFQDPVTICAKNDPYGSVPCTIGP